MKNLLITFQLFFCISLFSQDAIFLHHSTGGGVWNGGVSQWITNYNTTNSTSYSAIEFAYPNSPYPWANYPYDYWNIWLNGGCDNAQSGIECISSIAESYDLIIYKHCYPGAGISADVGSPDVSSSSKTLENYKVQYRALRYMMDTMPDTKFMVWTLAPLHRLATNTDAATRAGEFVDWVNNDWLTEDANSHSNIYIFDFFSYAAELDASPANGETNCLKYDYEGSHSGSDSHPNTLANQTIAPYFAEAIVNALMDTGQIINHTIEVINGTGGGTFSSGETVTIIANTPPIGQEFDCWTGSTGCLDNIHNDTAVVTMPIEDVSLTATYKNVQQTGLNEINIQYKVYPNPTSGNFTFCTQNNSLASIKLFDISGSLLLSCENITKMTFGENLEPGAYFLSMSQGSLINVISLIKE